MMEVRNMVHMATELTGTAELLHSMVWGPWTMMLFLGTGLLFTVRLRCFQVFGFRRWWSGTVGSLFAKDQKATAGITPFQSACTALAATIGTGNIAGVATALTAGGPGALFWMWVSALIGMATAYGETVLGQKYRYRDPEGHWLCGPMIYMERGMGCRPLGLLYAGFAVLASLGMGSMVQSNAMSSTLSFGLGVTEWKSGLVIVSLTAAVILGDIGRISKVAQGLMPLSAGVYLFCSGAVILSCYPVIPAVFRQIVSEAFSARAAGGGAAGFLLSRSLRYGISRGVFSNEAGLGSLAVLHGAAEETNPQQQGMWAMFEVFFDTIVICTLTALVILCTGYGRPYPAGQTGAALAAGCFSGKMGRPGELLVMGAMTVFAFATIIAWYYLGRQTAEYLLKCLRPSCCAAGLKLYTLCYLAAVFGGCLGRVEGVWLAADLANGLMAFPNLLALWYLRREVTFTNCS